MEREGRGNQRIVLESSWPRSLLHFLAVTFLCFRRDSRFWEEDQHQDLEFHFLSFPFPYSSLFNGEEIKGEERSVPEVITKPVSNRLEFHTLSSTLVLHFINGSSLEASCPFPPCNFHLISCILHFLAGEYLSFLWTSSEVHLIL